MTSIRHAFRQLAKSPWFSLVAILTLALGIGATTAFFSVLYGVVLRDPPYPDAGQLFEVHNRTSSGVANDGRLSLAELFDYRLRHQSFSGLGASVTDRVTLTAEQGAERVIITQMTANLLPLLGVSPAQGRNFTEAEEHAGHENVVLISHEFWQIHLGGVADVLGKTVRLNGDEHTIVGAMPAGFAFGEVAGTSLWKPLALDSHGDRRDHRLKGLARLAPGVSLAQAKMDLRRVSRQLQADLPNDYPADAEWSIGLQSLRENQFGRMTTPLSFLLAAAAAVLLLACVNVSIMFLLRAAARRREIMIRLALGASRRHLVRQLLAESAVVCAVGTAGGLVLAVFGLELLKAFPPGDIPRLHEVSLNGTVAAFTAGVLLLITMLVGLAPALATLKTQGNERLVQTTRSSETRGTARLRESLTVMEIALAALLLVSAGLTLRSLRGQLLVDLGFAPTQVLSFKTNLTEAAYPDAARTTRFYDRLTEKIAALPGVATVGAVSHLPLSGEFQTTSATVPAGGGAVDPSAPGPMVGWRVVRGEYFETMGLSLLRGRLFDRVDMAGSPFVTIVDDEFARRFWRDESSALGQQVRFGTGTSARVCTVVGLVRRVKHDGPSQDTLPEAYAPQSQHYQRPMYTVVKTADDAARLVPLIRAALAEVDPKVPMYFVETMERRYDRKLALPRFTAGLISAFSGLALVLAGVGIFGVMAYSVGQRTREFGIRFALGAPRSHVAHLVLGRVGRLALIGGTLGAAAAFQIAGLMKSFLFGVEPLDVPTLTGTAVVIGLTALLGSLVPLTRALRVNPVEALRAE